MNITPWPTKTSSSIVTPSQTKVCEEILQLRPIRTALLDLDEGANAAAAADRAAINVDEIGMRDDHVVTTLDIHNRHRRKPRSKALRLG